MPTIRPLRRDEFTAVAELIHQSTNAWYAARGLGPIFPGPPEDCRLFPEVYEDLDPGCCLVAVSDGGELVGSCFYHCRETHVALGIMNVRPEAAGRGIARQLLGRVIEIATAADRPLRLVSSCFNLDSFSLYTRQGLVPYEVFQDLTLTVPAAGLDDSQRSGARLRPGVPEDAAAIDALEQAVWQTSRRGDWALFLENARGIWHVTVAEDPAGGLLGAIASVAHPGSMMLGPGLARDGLVAGDLLISELNVHRGRSPVFLVPCRERDLVARMYRLGARNCELHLGQCLGSPPTIRGVVLPTFMPETA